MTKVEEAIGKLRSLPPERGEGIAAMVLMLTEEDGSFDYTAAEMARLNISEAQAARGEFATDDQVRAIWAKHGL